MGILHRICHDHQRPAWQVNSEIPDELSDIIERLLEKRPARRYSSATAVREDLMRILNNVQQPIPSLPLRIRSWRRRHPWWIESAVGAVLVLGVGLITARLFSSHTSDVQPPNVALDSSDREDQIRSEPKHGTPPMAPVTTSAKPAAPPPTELIAEVAPGEPANFASKLEQIKQKLDTLETVHRGVFSLPTPDNSQTEMQSILRQLDQLRTVTPETPRS
jgi:serine/threonine protein kinase